MEKYTIKELGEFINAINKNPDARVELTVDRCGGIASAFNGNGGLTLTIIPPAILQRSGRMQKDQKRIIKTPKIVAVDFDGTLCKDAYPNIGEPLPYSLYYIKKLAAAGNIIILHTCRNGALLDAAVAWCKERGIVFDYINENIPDNINRYGGDTRKIYADIYVDTNAVNPRRLYGIGENDEYLKIFEAAEHDARRELCDVKCLCPDNRAANMCDDCEVFLALREYYALINFEQMTIAIERNRAAARCFAQEAAAVKPPTTRREARDVKI